MENSDTARPSRRHLLIGAVAAGAGATASAVAGVQSAAASSGNSNEVQLGVVNSCSATTEIETTSAVSVELTQPSSQARMHARSTETGHVRFT